MLFRSLITSIYDRLAIDPNAQLPHPMGEDIRVMTPDDDAQVINPLREIMA